MKTALISVFNKSGVVRLAQTLIDNGYEIISTGGTYRTIAAGIGTGHIRQVSDVTGFPEILDGRVKTLHPMIYGALLARRNIPAHLETLKEFNIPDINIVVSNLYPFQEVVRRGDGEGGVVDLDTALENIDIGGPTMIRAAAKNFKDVLVLVDPNDYNQVIGDFGVLGNVDFHREMALKAFQHVTEYNGAISEFLSGGRCVTRMYEKKRDLKYGCNPYQGSAGLYGIGKSDLGYKVLNGKPGYINWLDAMGSWGLVRDLKKGVGLAAAASFKHTSPAGVGTAVGLSGVLPVVYDVQGKVLSDIATAFVRARQADPLSSFGDFIALSDVVDLCTAKLIRREISDGIIAPGYHPEALEVLKGKKSGRFIIIEAGSVEPTEGEVEFREIGGTVLSQERNTELVTLSDFVMENRVTTNKELDENAIRDLTIANITLKYTQSNSVCYTFDGQVIGVGAGQQNRVDCVRLAGQKARIWMLRQSTSAIEYLKELKRDTSLKRQDRVNLMVDKCRSLVYISYALKSIEREPIISMASDAFFPFPDSIEVALPGTKYIIQPGGSNNDPAVINACNERGILMVCNGKRMFLH